jgi:hypothetical protein
MWQRHRRSRIMRLSTGLLRLRPRRPDHVPADGLRRRDRTSDRLHDHPLRLTPERDEAPRRVELVPAALARRLRRPSTVSATRSRAAARIRPSTLPAAPRHPASARAVVTATLSEQRRALRHEGRASAASSPASTPAGRRASRVIAVVAEAPFRRFRSSSWFAAAWGLVPAARPASGISPP